jgi:metallophosphoesterase superfamily enzyme
VRTMISTDWHLSVTRTGGTTPSTQVKLRDYLAVSLANCLGSEDHLICGDLFDKFTVDTSEVIRAYEIFSTWLQQYGKNLALVRGNHDFSVRGDQVCSFDLLTTILQSQFPNQVTVARDVTVWKNFVLVPHLPNQDLLNLVIENLRDVRGKFVVFHANFDNGYCEHSDHSLNVDMTQTKCLVDDGATVLFGHEHVAKATLNGKVQVLGNTVPSSVADCLGNDAKYAYVLHTHNSTLEKVRTWSREDAEGYAEIDWRELELNPDADKGFIRVTGSAEAAEAEAVVDAISKYRAKSTSFVVTNAVRIAGMADMSAMGEVAAESIKAFDVLTALLDELDDRERKVVKEMLE